MKRFLILLWAASCLSFGAVIPDLDKFTSFPNRFVADIGNQAQFGLPLGGDNIVGPFTIGGVTITSGNAPLINGLYFASGSTGGSKLANSPDTPGNDAGAVISATSFFQNQLPDLVVNFSQPIFGFGATFIHDISSQPQFLNASGPATISVFSGLNGSGTLLGTTSDFGGTNIVDFIGLLSDTPNIQSAVLSSSGPTGSFQIDAFGISVNPAAVVPPAPVPEPAGFGLALIGLALCAAGRRGRE